MKKELEKNKNRKNNKQSIQSFDNTKKVIFIIDDKFEDVKKYKEIINLTKEKYLIEDEKINIMFLENKKGINFKILKTVFRKYKILGKVKLDK